MLEAVPMSKSRTIQSKLVLPPDTNYLHTIFGGKVLAYIDEIAAISSMKHCNKSVVTASIDSVDFLSPAHLGDVLELEAVVSSTGRTSMEIYIVVHSTNLLTGEKRLTTTSYVTMIAMDDMNKTTPVPAVYPETDTEKRIFDAGPARLAFRKKRNEMKL